MAVLPKKGIHPLIAVLTNFCCLGLVGYILIGQTRKGLLVFLATAVPPFVVSGIGAVLGSIAAGVVPLLGGMFIVLASLLSLGWAAFFGILGMVDVYQVASAVEAGEAIDENGYKLDVLHKIMSRLDKSATLQM